MKVTSKADAPSENAVLLLLMFGKRSGLGRQIYEKGRLIKSTFQTRTIAVKRLYKGTPYVLLILALLFGTW